MHDVEERNALGLSHPNLPIESQSAARRNALPIAASGGKMDWTEIGKWILAVIAGVGATGLVIRFVRKSTTTRTVIQMNNKAGRDIVGGDRTNKG